MRKQKLLLFVQLIPRNELKIHPDNLFKTRARALFWIVVLIMTFKEDGNNLEIIGCPRINKSALCNPEHVDKYFLLNNCKVIRLHINNDITPFIWVPFSVAYIGRKYRVVF